MYNYFTFVNIQSFPAFCLFNEVRLNGEVRETKTKCIFEYYMFLHRFGAYILN
jgi:hypothetical protein